MQNDQKNNSNNGASSSAPAPNTSKDNRKGLGIASLLVAIGELKREGIRYGVANQNGNVVITVMRHQVKVLDNGKFTIVPTEVAAPVAPLEAGAGQGDAPHTE